MGDQFNLSGDFRGAIVNIKSKLQNVQQTVGEIQGGDETARKELYDLIGKLSRELEKLPANRKEEADAVAETAKTLVEQAKVDKPNKTLLHINGEALKEAARSLGEILPSVLTIAAQIVMTVAKLH
jgi:hypothetical protein